MNDFELKNIALQAGLSKNQAIDLYDKAVFEAKHLGKEDDNSFVLSIVKTMAGLDEEEINNTIRNLNTRFIESGYKDFDRYLEDMWVSGGPGGGSPDGLVSTDFPANVRPEHMLGHPVKLSSDEEDEKEDEENK